MILLSRRARRRWHGGSPVYVVPIGRSVLGAQATGDMSDRAFRERFAAHFMAVAAKVANPGLARCSACSRYGSPDDVEFVVTSQGRVVCGDCRTNDVELSASEIADELGDIDGYARADQR